MRTLKETVNESSNNFYEILDDISNSIGDAFRYAENKKDAQHILEIIDESFVDIAVSLEYDEKFEILKELEAWANKHKFNL